MTEQINSACWIDLISHNKREARVSAKKKGLGEKVGSLFPL